MRSSVADIRNAATTTLRSVATGCCKAEHRDACGLDLFFEFVDFAVPDYHLLCQIEVRTLQ